MSIRSLISCVVLTIFAGSAGKVETLKSALAQVKEQARLSQAVADKAAADLEAEPGREPDICTDLVETAQRATPVRAPPAVKHAFVGCIHGGLSEGSASDGEMVIYSDGG